MILSGLKSAVNPKWSLGLGKGWEATLNSASSGISWAGLGSQFDDDRGDDSGVVRDREMAESQTCEADRREHVGICSDGPGSGGADPAVAFEGEGPDVNWLCGSIEGLQERGGLSEVVAGRVEANPVGENRTAVGSGEGEEAADVEWWLAIEPGSECSGDQASHRDADDVEFFVMPPLCENGLTHGTHRGWRRAQERVGRWDDVAGLAGRGAGEPTCEAGGREVWGSPAADHEDRPSERGWSLGEGFKLASSAWSVDSLGGAMDAVVRGVR